MPSFLFMLTAAGYIYAGGMNFMKKDREVHVRNLCEPGCRLKRQIETVRTELNKLSADKGIQSPEILKLSKKLDKLILKCYSYQIVNKALVFTNNKS